MTNVLCVSSMSCVGDCASQQIGANDLSKPAIWIDAGMHSREWIAPATALYVINKVRVQPQPANVLLQMSLREMRHSSTQFENTQFTNFKNFTNANFNEILK